MKPCFGVIIPLGVLNSASLSESVPHCSFSPEPEQENRKNGKVKERVIPIVLFDEENVCSYDYF